MMIMASSCGSGAPSSLSDDQTSRLQNLLDSTGRSYAAALQNSSISGASSSSSGDNAPPSVSNGNGILGAFSVDTPPSVAVSSDPFTARMAASLSAGQCSLQLTPASPDLSSDSNGLPLIFFALWTPDPLDPSSTDPSSGFCPMTMNFELDVQSDSSQGYSVSSVNYKYSVGDSSFSQLNDVDQTSLAGDINLINIGTPSADAIAEISGKIHSQTLGEITINIEGSLQGTGSPTGALNGQMTWDFQFPDFLAEFKQTYVNGGITYSLNGNAISQADFDAYFLRAGDPFYYVSALDRTGPTT
jgi:hypothetical protein